MAVDQTYLKITASGGHVAFRHDLRAVRHPDRDAVFVGELESTAGMVVVFVGDDDAGQRLGGYTESGESGGSIPQAEAAIQ